MRKLGIVNLVSGIREIKKVVVAGRNGAVREAANEPDAETVAAVVGFSLNLIDKNGAVFGLGATERVIMKHGKGASIVVPLDDAFLTALVDDGSSVPTVERKLNGVLFGKPS